MAAVEAAAEVSVEAVVSSALRRFANTADVRKGGYGGGGGGYGGGRGGYGGGQGGYGGGQGGYGGGEGLSSNYPTNLTTRTDCEQATAVAQAAATGVKLQEAAAGTAASKATVKVR